MPVIRLSPSGAPIQGNPEFTGLQLRLAESNNSCATLALTTGYAPIQTTSNVDQILLLANPVRLNKFKFNSLFQLNRLVPTSASVSVQLQKRIDGGPWVAVDTVDRVDTALQPEGKTLFACNQAALSGAAVDWSVPTGALLLEVRLVAKASAAASYEIANDGGSGDNENPIWMSLAELNG